MQSTTQQLQDTWEREASKRTAAALAFGPPSWLVKERQRPGEDFLEAAARVRRDYFGADLSPKVVPITNVPTALSPLCDECFSRTRETGRKLCAGCRKAKQRS